MRELRRAARRAPADGLHDGSAPSGPAGAVDFGLRVAAKCTTDKVGAFAAQIAFFIIMSVFPFAILFLQLIRFMPVSQEDILFAVDTVFPTYLLSSVHSILQEVFTTSYGLVPLTVVAMLWAASKVMHAMAAGLDAICTKARPRNWFVVRGWSLLCTFVLAFVLALAVMSTVVWRTIRAFLIRCRPGGLPLSTYSDIIGAIYSVLVMTLVFSVLYKALPRRRLRYLEQLPGALFAAVGIYFFSLFLAVYVRSFNGFSAYGSLTILTLAMFWLYFSCYIMMIGAVVNEVLRELRAGGATGYEATPADAPGPSEPPSAVAAGPSSSVEAAGSSDASGS